MLLWLWHRPAAEAPIWPLAWEHPYAVGATLKKTKTKPKKHSTKNHGLHILGLSIHSFIYQIFIGSYSVSDYEMLWRYRWIRCHPCTWGSQGPVRWQTGKSITVMYAMSFFKAQMSRRKVKLGGTERRRRVSVLDPKDQKGGHRDSRKRDWC